MNIWVHFRSLWWVRVAHCFFCVVFLLCLFTSCVSNVASVSWLSILGCYFRFYLTLFGQSLRDHFMIAIWQFINNWFSSIYNCLHTLCVFEIYLQYPVKDRQHGVVKLVYLWHQYSPAETNPNSTQMALFQVVLSEFCSCISVDVFILISFFCIRFVDSIYLWIVNYNWHDCRLRKKE